MSLSVGLVPNRTILGRRVQVVLVATGVELADVPDHPKDEEFDEAAGHAGHHQDRPGDE